MGQLCGGLGIAFYFGWEMTLVTMSVAPAIAVVIYTANVLTEKANAKSDTALQSKTNNRGRKQVIFLFFITLHLTNFECFSQQSEKTF